MFRARPRIRLASTSMASRDDPMFEITPQVLLKAYSCGIFPMAESADDPALYWIEPQQRGVLPLDGLHIPRRLLRTVRTTSFTVKVDNNYDRVIDGCAAPRAGRMSTWINTRIRALYRDLFERGACHTVEVWDGDKICRRSLWRRAQKRLLRREHVFNGTRRFEDRSCASHRAIDPWRLLAARHPIRDRASTPIRHHRARQSYIPG